MERVSDYEFANLAIDRAPANLYVQRDAFDFVPAQAKVERFHATHSGFCLGIVEGAANAYFVNHGRWQHLHSID